MDIDGPGGQVLHQGLSPYPAGNQGSDAFRAVDGLDDGVGLGTGDLAKMCDRSITQLALHGHHDEHSRQRRDQHRPGQGIAQHIALYCLDGSDALLGHVASRPLSFFLCPMT